MQDPLHTLLTPTQPHPPADLPHKPPFTPPTHPPTWKATPKMAMRATRPATCAHTKAAGGVGVAEVGRGVRPADATDPTPFVVVVRPMRPGTPPPRPRRILKSPPPGALDRSHTASIPLPQRASPPTVTRHALPPAPWPPSHPVLPFGIGSKITSFRHPPHPPHHPPNPPNPPPHTHPTHTDLWVVGEEVAQRVARREHDQAARALQRSGEGGAHS